ncbi:MAG: hypothetical protein ACD_16C00104G0006 [uncultured bacterium]|nr:MAG: hypothetical protein ACD_16C00104G0006 [uncultured bacterium]OFW70026.1 MAG: hypothetical protein A2X70_01815 [Alphaproteobacteria bacterium GWC2_42_16]OFW74492.1 MAG: hypothetical protein A2Z80_02025 [Alphaproteobacteria bacterium GWA2_41_27]OFW84695.1 MAG: hypothetical protein A3E50_05940 [Alphaproteobacteria bacterium RIFCSPHIGHO2_12_FULL_42_100]OFW85440.1 MAG: hypothetical protein A2W06_07130 [Alphaproteobacteria bacterium RBG_16_42_14]OFW90713.1 MAG: hypothetical protein A2W46_076
MKKYLIALLALTIMTTTSSAVNTGLSQQCITKLNDVVEELEHKSLQEVLSDGTWDKFKNDARSAGKWDEIVKACYSPIPNYDCTGCQCGMDDDCSSHCMCCWGTQKCPS